MWQTVWKIVFSNSTLIYFLYDNSAHADIPAVPPSFFISLFSVSLRCWFHMHWCFFCLFVCLVGITSFRWGFFPLLRFTELSQNPQLFMTDYKNYSLCTVCYWLSSGVPLRTRVLSKDKKKRFSISRHSKARRLHSTAGGLNKLHVGMLWWNLFIFFFFLLLCHTEIYKCTYYVHICA